MTIGAEALGSFAIASTRREILNANAGVVEVDGLAGQAVVGQNVQALVGVSEASGQQGQAIVGNVITATVGSVTFTALSGQVVAGVSLAGQSSTVDVIGFTGSLTVGQAIAATSGSIDVTGQTGTTIIGGAIVATAGTVTVTGFEGTIVYSVAVQPQQVQIFDLVNVALNDIFGTPVYYVKDGTRYTLEGTFTDESEVIGAEGQIITTAPQVNIRRADMPYHNSPKQDEVLSVNGRAYRVWDWRLDDSDAYQIMLKAHH